MHKYIIIFLFTFVLNANEPILAKMVNVDSNEVQKLSIGNYTFYCRPYGVLSLAKLHSTPSLNQECKKKIQTYYKKNPHDRYYAQSLFKRGQWYHVEFKQKSCVIYAKGQYTYSELLLKKGLAARKPNFTDPEFKASFYKAQKIGRSEKKGIWKDAIVENCVSEIYN